MKSAKSLKWNAAANFIGLGYITVIGIVILPLYLQYLGAEAFGLVGFFITLQAWMQLLDMGMSPLLSRQAARMRGHNESFLALKKLVRSLELIIFILAMIAFLSISSGSLWIANNWLNISSLELTKVASGVVLMGAIIGLRFFSSLYRSGIQGMENQVRLNVANILLITLKFPGALLLLQFVTQDFIYFFVYQLFVGVVELMVLAIMFYHSMPSTDKVGVRFFWDELKPMLPFTGGLAYSVLIWILLTQLDKMILSNILPLSEYGYFALVAIVSAGILQISSPVGQAILPRMSYLLSQGKEKDMLSLYRKSTQIVIVIMVPLTGVTALFSTELLFAWTGDNGAAEWAGPVLFWFSLGNGILAMNAFQYYLQFAHGNLRMHVIYTTISAIIQIPVVIYVAFEYGALGVAQVWFALRLVSFIIWAPIVHRKYAPGMHLSWLRKDVAPTFFLTSLLLVFIQSLNIEFESMTRTGIFIILTGVGAMIVSLTVAFSVESRKLVINIFQAVRSK